MLDQLYGRYTEWVTPRRRVATELTVPTRPLAALRLALITTAGVRLAAQPAFDTEHGDPSHRMIPAAVAPETLVVDHTHFDTGPARADLDCVFPLHTLQALAAAGVIAGLTNHHYGLMGYIPDTKPLVAETTPAIIRQLQEDSADAVLLSPG